MEEGDRERPPPTRQPGDHYTGQPYNSISYQPEYPGQDSQARQQFPPFEYNIPPTPQAFAPMQSYPPARHGQNAAIEVLSSQFSGAPQQYYVTGDPATPVGPPATPHQHHHQQQQQQQPPTQFSSPPYTQYGNNSPAAARLPPLPYPASVPDLNPPAAAEPDDAEYSQHQAAQLDEAYSQYQTALKRTFQNMREGRLGEAGTSLLTISDWLLSNAVELGT